ncbi:hypothetical protein H2200_001619 [Cladophialophora chaetospira]|uniref:Uncharacterized protein n=1 Tax=Cladophialophora chaetospira TaxID=386627 RepID=A0AA38XL91_9EURO|nr:hypothetical protein H2200_001619 [Cladophialophora chaetospira]
MAVDPEDDIFTPLPPKLPPKKSHHDDEPKHYKLEERSPQRYRKVKVVHDRFDDDDHHPKVESSPSPPRSKRDSGKYLMSGARMDDIADRGPQEYERRRPVSDPEVQRLREDIERLKLERRDAQLAASAAKDKAERYKADLEFEKRQRSLEKRERDIAKREEVLKRERDQLREPRPRQEVVVVQPSGPLVQTRDSNRSALDRARDDFQRDQREQRAERATDARRPATGDRQARRERIVIVDDEEPDRNRDNDRGQRRR